MHEEIADGHLARDVGIRELEPGHVVDDGRIPADLPFVHEHAERCRGEGLRVRRNAEERPRIHGLRLAECLHAVAARDHDGAVLDDRQRDSRDLERFHGALDPGIEVRRGGGRGLRNRDDEQEKEGGDCGARHGAVS